MKTREEKVQRMIDQVENWDLDCLIDVATYHLEHTYKDMTDEQIDQEYKDQFEEDDEEECVASSVQSLPAQPQSLVCTCDLNTLMARGCVCGGQ